MLTRKTYKFLGHHYFFARLLSAIPFKWDTQTEMLTCVTNKFELCLWQFNNLSSLAIVGCILRSFIVGIQNGDRSIAALSTDAMYIITYGGHVFFCIQLILNREEMAELLNALTIFDKRYTLRYCPKDDDRVSLSNEDGDTEKEKNGKKKEKEPTDGCDANIFLSTYMMFVYGLLSTSVFMKKPDDPRYLYNFIPYPWGEKPQWVLYSWAAMEYLQLLKFCCTFNNVFDIIMLYARCVTFWLDELSRPGIKSDEVRTITAPVKRSEVLLNYKAQIVLNNLFNKCSSSIMLPAFQSLNMGLHVVAMYVSIMYYDAMPLGQYLIFPIGFFMWCAIEKDTYPLLGKIQDLSVAYKVTWKPAMAKEGKRNMRALKDLGVMVSTVSVVEKDTILHVWSNVLGQVINLILL